MTVEQAIELLMEQPMGAQLLICAHEFEGDGDGWHVQAFEPTEGGGFVMIEGAHPIGGSDGTVEQEAEASSGGGAPQEAAPPT